MTRLPRGALTFHRRFRKVAKCSVGHRRAKATVLEAKVHLEW